MNVALQKPWTQERFFAWAQSQDIRYEFDCDKPVAKARLVSPTSGRTDRIVKVREYAAVASIRSYVIVESSGVGLTVLERYEADDPWLTRVLTIEDSLAMPEIGIKIPVAEIYADITFPDQDDATV